MKQVKIFVVLLLLIPLGVNGKITPNAEGEYLSYSTYNAVTQEWTNMTLTSDSYEINSNNAKYDGFSGQLKMNPWDSIAIELEKSTFFNSQHKEDNPHTILEIRYQGESNTHYVNQADINPDGLIAFIDKILYRIAGYGEELVIWPVDMQVLVMESYPEQYSVSLLLQRGNDFLTYEHEENATLIISDYNIIEGLSSSEKQPQAIYIDRQAIFIASGGQSVEFSFDSFSVGTDYSPSSLHFTLIMDSGAYLYYFPSELKLPTLNYVGNTFMPLDIITLNSAGQTEDSGDLELPISFIFVVSSLALIPLIRKKFDKKKM